MVWWINAGRVEGGRNDVDSFWGECCYGHRGGKAVVGSTYVAEVCCLLCERGHGCWGGCCWCGVLGLLLGFVFVCAFVAGEVGRWWVPDGVVAEYEISLFQLGYSMFEGIVVCSMG